MWVDGALCFGGSPGTRWVRNLMANLAIVLAVAFDSVRRGRRNAGG